MKKSEAIKILRKAIYKNCANPHNDINDDDKAMSNILTALEKAGMSPPFVDEIDDDLKLIGRKWEEE